MHTLDDLVAEMAKNLKEIPGLEYNFSQPIRDNVAENISGQFGQIALKIYGDDLDEAAKLRRRRPRTRSPTCRAPPTSASSSRARRRRSR